MLLQLVMTGVAALVLSPCVVQRVCPAGPARPPSSVCMHRVYTVSLAPISPELTPNAVGYIRNKRKRSSLYLERGRGLWIPRMHIARQDGVRARLRVQTLLRVPLVLVLLYVPLHLPHHALMPTPLMITMGLMMLFATLALIHPSTQATTGCKNCVILGKEQRAMFRVHSASCAESSGVSARTVEALEGGGGDLRALALHERDPRALRRHVYCVLLKCKLITKDGKLQKAALREKVPTKADGKNATKVLERCAEQGGDSPEDIAWNIFRCGYDKKALLFNYMPTATPPVGAEDNS